MILKFSKQNPYLIERAKYFKGAGAWYNNVLQITSEDARILRWQENEDDIVIQFDRSPGEAAAYGKQIAAFTFDKPDKTLLFDMKKSFELGYNEHPDATAERLKLIRISYNADAATGKVTMVVFDPFDNVPEWVTLLK